MPPTDPLLTPDNVDELAKIIEAIASSCVAYVSAEIQRRHLDICLGCGCLVKLDEHCPGCAAKRTNRKAA